VAVVDKAGTVKRLTGEYSSTQGLAWKSPNEIWFTGAGSGSARALHAVTLDGAVRTLARVPANLQLGDINAKGDVLLWQENARRGIAGRLAGETADRDLSWLDWSQPIRLSADAKQVLITEEGDGGGSDYGVYLRPTDGGPAVRLGSGEGMDISPDGKWVLVQKLTPAPAQLVLLPTGAGDPRPVTNDALAHDVARFMPNGRQILFIGFEPGKKARTYLQDLEGGTPRAVTPEGIISSIVSPDGAWLPARAADGSEVLYPVAGGNPVPVKGIEPADRPIRWTADGLGLFVGQPGGTTGSARIVRVDRSTGQRTVVREIVPIPSALASGGVGQVLLTPDASGYLYGYGVTLADLYLVTKLK
jgi:dipeptidyl aminopeptidase/acylaminoacyl peptidase